MKITINSHTVNSSNPLIVSYKFVMDTDNGLRYDFNSFDKEQFTEHSLLLVDNESIYCNGIQKKLAFIDINLYFLNFLHNTFCECSYNRFV